MWRRSFPRANSRADALRVDVVFPVLHGTFGEDGTVQGLLDLAGLPYVGSGVLGSAVGMDKDMQKRLFLQAKLPVGDFLAIPRAEWEKSRAKVLRAIRKKFRFPVFVKPATLGSSVGMTKAHDAKELATAMDFAAEFAQKIMVERAIRGREIELSVLGNEDPEGVDSRRNRAAPRILRLRGEISRGRHAPADSREADASAGQTIPGICRPGVPRARMPGHGARGFFPRASHRQNPTERRSTRFPASLPSACTRNSGKLPACRYRELLDRLIELALAQHREKQRTKYTIELPAAATSGALE